MRSLLVLIVFVFATVSAAPVYADANVRAVDIWSDGTRLTGDLWVPEGRPGEGGWPAVVLAHGWGGTRGSLNRSYAPAFVAAGFVVLTFDYRGWGDSDGRLVTIPKGENGPEEIRGVVDPADQVRDFWNAVNFVAGEPDVDAQRIGIWGTSYAGGHVIALGARDERIAAIVAQVGFMGVSSRPALRVKGAARAIQKARGEIGAIPPAEDALPRLGGIPDLAKMVHYRPIDNADKIGVPTLIIDVEGEDLFDRKANGRAVYEIVRGSAPADYLLLSGKHYDIYGLHHEAALARAVSWFTEHL